MTLIAGLAIYYFMMPLLHHCRFLRQMLRFRGSHISQFSAYSRLGHFFQLQHYFHFATQNIFSRRRPLADFSPWPPPRLPRLRHADSMGWLNIFFAATPLY